MAERIYLDWNATAPLRPQARAAAAETLGICGNPSSVHAEGRAVRRLIEEARESVAALVGAEPRNVVFTSGGTEANMMALSPFMGSGPESVPRDCLVISAIEHPSVLAGGGFPRNAIETVPVTPDGRLDLSALGRLLSALAQKGVRRPLVSLMLANNETGVVQPVSQAAALARAAGALMHVDAVQGAGRIACNINELGADLLTLSGHKIGGPKGIGAVIRRDQALHFADPLIKGGGQERGARAGTENVAGIVGFGAAAAVVRHAVGEESARMAALRDRLEAGLKARMPAAIVFGAQAGRLPNTTLFAVPGIRAETAVIALDLEGIAVSSGAACSSGKVQPSHVLAAMGVAAPLAQGAIRVSLGPTTTESEVDRFQDAWIRLSKGLLKRGEGIAA
ncbi:MAG TPA: cysteine desulfurase family protein [Xanthobacteraceae bacterium]|jgi:cysteine desulfurase